MRKWDFLGYQTGNLQLPPASGKAIRGGGEVDVYILGRQEPDPIVRTPLSSLVEYKS